MKIPGYCTECHRIKTVDAGGHAVAMSVATKSVVQGVCDVCTDAAEQKRKERRGQTRRR